MTVLDWRTAWAAVVVHPLFSVALTLIAFQLALMLYRRSGWLVLQPVMVGMLLVVGTLTLVDLDYARYRDGAALVAMLLGPATVALAVPLHRHLKRIQQLFWPIVITLAVGGVLSVVLTLAISLAAVFVMLTGVIGTALGPLLLRWAGVEHPAARGLSYGLNAHAIGTARALEEGDECGAFAALGMSLLGILIALLLPFALG